MARDEEINIVAYDILRDQWSTYSSSLVDVMERPPASSPVPIPNRRILQTLVGVQCLTG
jgi:hypothetical protein